jgi:hypothetical protein
VQVRFRVSESALRISFSVKAISTFPLATYGCNKALPLPDILDGVADSVYFSDFV